MKRIINMFESKRTKWPFVLLLHENNKIHSQTDHHIIQAFPLTLTSLLC